LCSGGTGKVSIAQSSGVSVNDESSLIDQSLQGNSAAFGQLVRDHQNRLYNAIVHVVGDRVEAEDVVQEAFVQAYLKLETFQRQSAFYTWLYRIAFNNAVSRKRRKRVETSVDLARELGGSEPEDSDDAPTARLERQEQAQQIHEALSRLTDEHRSILVLREIEEFDYEAIAEVLDINIGTVRSRLHRARVQLRDKLKEIQDG
jgi:RNA polymerase sigma-70 factor (ECF subfamily)